MKLIHTADWHLGHQLHGFDRVAEFRHFFSWLSTTIETYQPDALLVSGDVFNSPNPSAEAERLFFDFLNSVTQQNQGLQVVVTSGDHDSALRLEAPGALLNHLGVEVRGLMAYDEKHRPDYSRMMIPLVSRTDETDRAVVLAMPCLLPADCSEGEMPAQATARMFGEMVKAARNSLGRSFPLVAMAHVAAAGVTGVDSLGVVDCSAWGRDCSYVALGHSHCAQTVANQDNVRYSGSVLPLSFEEKAEVRGVNLVELKADGVEQAFVEYQPLRAFQTVPEEGSSANFKELMKLLDKLPKGKRLAQNDDWPYLEVRLAEQAPTAAMMSAIAKELSDKKVMLCRMIKVRANGEPSGDNAYVASSDDLKRLNPALIAHALFNKVYGEEMPNEIARLFAQAKRRAEAE